MKMTLMVAAGLFLVMTLIVFNTDPEPTWKHPLRIPVKVWADYLTHTGMEYYKGDYSGTVIVVQDFAKAGKYFREAAMHDWAPAQHCLAQMYYYGRGVPQDYDEAVKWLRKAASHGLSDAEYSLGLMYRNGLGVQEDEEEARKWFEKVENHKGNVRSRWCGAIRVP